MANFTIPYTTPANYTYDNSVIEIDSGLAKLKNLIPVDETFYASYNTDINGSRGLGVLTGTAYGGASISGGKLDLAHGDQRYVDYNADLNADSQQVGCVRFKVTPNYSGAPANDRWFFAICKQNNSKNNLIELRQSNSGAYLRLHVYDKDGIFVVEHLCGQFIPVAGTEYEIEVNWDFTTGATRVFVNGNQNGSTCTNTCLRDSNIELLRIGNDYNKGAISDFKIDDFQVFSSVQHTSNYTPLPCAEHTYCITKPTIYKTDGDTIANIEEWINFLETLGGGNEGSITYQLSEDAVTWKYWNGSIWTIAGATNYNSVTVVNNNIGDFPAEEDKIYVKAFFLSDGEQQVELDLNEVGYAINTAPMVYAGINKNAIYNVTITPFSDCTFSDSETNIDKAEWKIEGGVYAEISQGAYATLLEAVQAFEYTPTHSGNKNIYLKITDEYDAYTEDSLVLNVDRVNIAVTIKDENGYNLPNVTFNPGDSQDASLENSPFTYTYYIGSWTTTGTKNRYEDLSEAVSISISSTSLDFVMTKESVDYEINLDIPYKIAKGDSASIDCKVNKDISGFKVRCEIYDNYLHSIKLANTASGGGDTQIEMINPSIGEFTIYITKDTTDNFKENSFIEIEIEDSNGKVTTVYEDKFKFEDEELNWTTP